MNERRRNAIYLIIAVCLLAGLATGRSFFFHVGYAFGGLLLFSLLWAWASSNWIGIRRRAQGRRAQVGGSVVETFTIKNTGPLPKLWLEVYDYSSLPGHGAGHVVSSLMPQEAESWRTETLCTQRGEYQLGPMRIVTGDPFGLFQIERKLEQTSRLIVYPPTVDVSGFTMPAGPLPGGNALRQRTHFVTTNAAGVRDYMPGDGLNRIHWRSTARKQRLLVKEFELDPLADVWIMLDAEQHVHATVNASQAPEASQGGFVLPPTSEEYAVTTAASLARFFLMKDRAVGFAAHSNRREHLQVDRGGRQLNKILETLAVLRTEGQVPFDQFLTREAERFARGTTLVLITPSTRDTWVNAAAEYAARGLQVTAVIIDAESFGGRPGAHRVTTQLGERGIRSYVVRRGDSISMALS